MAFKHNLRRRTLFRNMNVKSAVITKGGRTKYIIHPIPDARSIYICLIVKVLPYIISRVNRRRRQDR